MDNIYYERGKKAKELLNIYANNYEKGTFEHDEFNLGFSHGIYEPLNLGVELEEDTDFIDQFEELKIINL